MKTCNDCPHCDAEFALCKLDYKVRPVSDTAGRIYMPRGCPLHKNCPRTAGTDAEAEK